MLKHQYFAASILFLTNYSYLDRINLGLAPSTYADNSYVLLANGSRNQAWREFTSKAERITVLVIDDGSFGSGTIISNSQENYYILTSSHVLKTGNNTRIRTSDLRYHEASVVTRRLANLDLALLRFTSPINYEVAVFSDGSGMNSGSFISGASSTFISGWSRREENHEFILTCGISVPEVFSTVLRQDPATEGYDLAYTNQTQPGLSGGPIINAKGQVIGVHGRAEGEELDFLGELNLGLSLGIPTSRILAVLQNTELSLDIGSESLIDNNNASNLDASCSTNDIRPTESSNAIEWANYANSMLRQFRLDEALEAYDQAINEVNSVNGELYQLWYGRGLTLILLQRLNEASENFLNAIEIWERIPANQSNDRLKVARALIWRYQGMLRGSQQDYRAALYAYENALQIMPHDRNLLLLKATALSRLGRHDEALSIYNELNAAYPSSYFLGMTRINALISQNQLHIALDHLNNMIANFPEDPNIYATRGALYRRLGNTQNSDLDYQEVYRLYDSQAYSSFVDIAGVSISQAEAGIGLISPSEWIGQALDSTDIAPEMGDLVYDFMSVFDDYILRMPSDSSSQLDFVEGIRSALENFSFGEQNLGQQDIQAYAVFLWLQNKVYQRQEATEEEVSYLTNEANNSIRSGGALSHVGLSVRSAILYRNGRITDANEDFRNALESNASHRESYFVRGMTHSVLGNLEEGISDLHVAADLAREENDLNSYRQIMMMIDRISY